jgi:hypothetical protein
VHSRFRRPADVAFYEDLVIPDLPPPLIPFPALVDSSGSTYHDPLQLPEVPPPAPAPLPPRITFITLWSPQDREHSYLPNFFASVGANPDIELLLIKFDKYQRGGDECTRERAWGVPNVREVCLTLEEYYAMHIEYLCGFWECSKGQRAEAERVMKMRFEGDRVCCTVLYMRYILDIDAHR